jgi:hypothetical protein
MFIPDNNNDQSVRIWILRNLTQTNISHTINWALITVKTLWRFQMTSLLPGIQYEVEEILPLLYENFTLKLQLTYVETNATDITRVQYTKLRCVAPSEDEQVMLETCRGPHFLINWIESASRWLHYIDFQRLHIFMTRNKQACLWFTNHKVADVPLHRIEIVKCFRSWIYVLANRSKYEVSCSETVWSLL